MRKKEEGKTRVGASRLDCQDDGLGAWIMKSGRGVAGAGQARPSRRAKITTDNHR